MFLGIPLISVVRRRGCQRLCGWAKEENKAGCSVPEFVPVPEVSNGGECHSYFCSS